jgi:molecular chaperone GrpE (heat shock protein)
LEITSIPSLSFIIKHHTSALMSEQSGPNLPKWPFLLGDGVMIGLAYFLYYQSRLPMGAWQIFFVVLCVGGGACLAIMPFLLEYKLWMKYADVRGARDLATELQKVEKVGVQISEATALWQNVQAHADTATTSARDISERMAGEVKAFTEFMQRANDAEKSTLRMEVEKLRRTEQDWLQLVVRLLDHTFALHLGAVRSGQKTVAEQVGNFQNACRESARRLGVTPFVPSAGEAFDAEKHQLMDDAAKPPENALVEETIASGYTFQGRMLRPALVRVGKSSEPSPEPDPQSQLPLPALASR